MGKGKYYEVTKQILKHSPNETSQKTIDKEPISNNPNFKTLAIVYFSILSHKSKN